MSPGEENQDQFIDNITVGNVEIVFERRDIDVAVELFLQVSIHPVPTRAPSTDVLLHVFCAML